MEDNMLKDSPENYSRPPHFIIPHLINKVFTLIHEKNFNRAWHAKNELAKEAYKYLGNMGRDIRDLSDDFRYVGILMGKPWGGACQLQGGEMP